MEIIVPATLGMMEMAANAAATLQTFAIRPLRQIYRKFWAAVGAVEYLAKAQMRKSSNLPGRTTDQGA
jgi:hypothetical protein